MTTTHHPHHIHRYPGHGRRTGTSSSHRGQNSLGSPPISETLASEHRSGNRSFGRSKPPIERRGCGAGHRTSSSTGLPVSRVTCHGTQNLARCGVQLASSGCRAQLVGDATRHFARSLGFHRGGLRRGDGVGDLERCELGLVAKPNERAGPILGRPDRECRFGGARSRSRIRARAGLASTGRIAAARSGPEHGCSLERWARGRSACEGRLRGACIPRCGARGSGRVDGGG